MPENDERRAEATVKVMKELAEAAGKITQPGLSNIAKLQGLRAKRLSLTAKRLEKSLGSSDSRVTALRAQAAASEQMSAALEVERQRDARRPRPTAKEWMVRGRLYSSSGEPVKGAKVRIYEKEPGADNLIGEVESDKFGDYAITYHERVFAGTPDTTGLVIEIVDRDGNVLQPGVFPYDAPEPWPQAPLPPSRTHLAKAETRPLAAHGARHHPFG